MAGAALAGCVKNEPIAKDDGSPERIAFEAPVVSIPTKATEIADNYPADKDFSVFALYHEGDFSSFAAGKVYMNDVKCEKPTDQNYWAPSDKDYYWPKNPNDKLTFAAYAPSSVAAAWNAQGFTFTDFTVADTPADQIDLLYSDRVYNQTKSSMVTNDPYNGVTIPFKHALSSIVFTAKTEAEYTDYTFKITEITVNKVINKGTFKQNLKEDNTGYIDGKTGPEWEVGTEVKDYVVFSGEKTLTTTAQYFNAQTTATDGKRNSDLILIPQSLKDGDGETDRKVTVTVKYTKEQTSGTSTITEDVVSTFQLATGTEANKLFNWEMNKRYTYNISIGLNKITFNPTVTGYEDGGGILE